MRSCAFPLLLLVLHTAGGSVRAAMRPSLQLRMYTAQLTLFTRSNCGLCDTAKARLATVQKNRTVDYSEIDIMDPTQKKWRDVYEFDVPVLHVERVFHTYSKPNIVSEAKKLMHRFEVADVEKLIDETEQGDVMGG